MALIRIREREIAHHSDKLDQLQAVLSFEHGTEYPITLHPPFSEEQERNLEWYFEEHLSFPFTEKVRAEQTAATVREYGEKLFEQIFADHKAYALYDRYKQAGFAALQVEIAGSPAFHQLHWEALKDPEYPVPLALEATMLRKDLHPQLRDIAVRPSSTIHILLVTARPNGGRDVGYRTISRSLVEELRQARLPVKIDILRPGTYKALTEGLRTVENGHYHIVHFDVHGSLMTHEMLQRAQQLAPYLYRYGRADIKPYDGVKAFLFLEGESGEGADPVEAGELADLLMRHQVPIAILNACQSGKQVGEQETSLGSRLIQAGVQVVLAMGYSVTVSAAELLMRTLYRSLFAHDSLARAISIGRQELYSEKARRANFNQYIKLEDWLLPVLYQNSQPDLRVQPMTPEELSCTLQEDATRYKPRQPEYGFIGRDLDILQIEKRLLMKRNLLLVRGMGGAGKTTLLHHLGSWWQTTGLAKHVFYFGYDERGWTRQQVLNGIAQRLLGKKEYRDTFQSLSAEKKLSLLASRLRAERHLLILDNLESINGAKFALSHPLSPKELNALHELLIELVGGKTLVLLGSRSSEGWLAKNTFGDNRYDLPGLDPEAASQLAQRVLERNNATRYVQDPDLRRLLKLLNGFPLALEVVLANLAKQTPAAVLHSLQAGNIDLDKGDTQQKTESILLCIDYSYRNLSTEAQELLICLAPFTSILSTGILPDYIKFLKEQPELAPLPLQQLPDVIREAQNWGMLTPHPAVVSRNLLSIQPVLPYFLRERLNNPERVAQKRAVEAAFSSLYKGWSHELFESFLSGDTHERQTAQVLIGWEYENLLTALHLALAQYAFIGTFYITLSSYLNTMKYHQRTVELGCMLLQRLEEYPIDRKTEQFFVELTFLTNFTAIQYTQQREYEKAEVFLQKALAIVHGMQDDRMKAVTQFRGSIYHNLGRVMDGQRKWEQAKGYYKQAVKLFIESDEHSELAGTYGEIGIVELQMQKWGEAQKYFEKSLQIAVKYNNLEEQVFTYHNLGRTALEQKNSKEAQVYFERSLQLKKQLHMRHEQGSTYMLLGVLAQEQAQWEQAQRYLEQALQIYIEYDDHYNQAMVYHNLGELAERQGKREEAENYYEQAQQIFADYKDSHTQGETYRRLGKIAQEQGQREKAQAYYKESLKVSNDSQEYNQQALASVSLGRVAQEQRKWEEAKSYYEQALHLFVGDHAWRGRAVVYYLLAMMMEEQEKWEEARKYYTQELQIYVENKLDDEQAPILRQLGIVEYEQGNWKQAQKYYEQALSLYTRLNDSEGKASCYYNLSLLAQQRRQWKEAKEKCLMALKLWNATSPSRVWRTLAQVWLATGDTTLPVDIASILETTQERVEKLLSKALTEGI